MKIKIFISNYKTSLLQTKCIEYFYRRFLQNHNTDYPYIGGSDIKQEGTWIWVDNCPIIYKNFNDNQPDDHDKNEDCLHIHKSSGKWNDISCNMKPTFICEVSETNSLEQSLWK